MLHNQEQKAALKIILLPPAGSGSKGDEAMILGVMSLLRNANLIIFNPQERSWRSEIATDEFDFMEESYSVDRLIELVKEGFDLLVIGADVIDGPCGVSSSLLLIEAMRTAIDTGGSVYAFFSFKSDPEPDIIEALKDLSQNERIHFFPRDMHSLDRFRDMTGATASFFPDFSFYCPTIPAGLHSTLPCSDSITRNQIVALNFSEQSFRVSRAVAYDKNARERFVRCWIDTMLKFFPDAHYILLTNDIRCWGNFWSDYDYALLARDILLEMGVPVEVVDPALSFAEIIDRLGNVDVLLSGRMHLSIAAFRAHTVPIVFTGRAVNSDVNEKQRGMFDKARGMFDRCMGRPNFVVTNHEELTEALTEVLHNRQKIVEDIERRDQENRLLAGELAEFLLDKIFNNQREASAKQRLQRNTDSLLKLFRRERIFLEHERRKISDTLQDRTAWALSLDKELQDRTAWAQSLDKELQAVREAKTSLQEQLISVQGQLHEQQASFQQLIGSRSWKITRPLRFLARLARYGLTIDDRQRLIQAIRQYYHRLPLPAQVKRIVSFTFHSVVGNTVRFLYRRALKFFRK